MEKLIAFNKFDNEDAFLLGCNLVEKVKKENLKNILINHLTHVHSMVRIN